MKIIFVHDFCLLLLLFRKTTSKSSLINNDAIVFHNFCSQFIVGFCRRSLCCSLNSVFLYRSHSEDVAESPSTANCISIRPPPTRLAASGDSLLNYWQQPAFVRENTWRARRLRESGAFRRAKFGLFWQSRILC